MSGASEKRYDLGVLFVHGMGEQERGDTITQMGDALTEWIRRWVAADRNADSRILEATLRQAPDVRSAAGAASPVSHATIELIDQPGSQEATSQRWLLAESWWADVFRQATFGELATWAISVGPWLIASQRRGVFRRVLQAQPGWASGDVGRGLLWVLKAVTLFGLYVIALLLAALVAPLAILLMLVAILPIPFVSDLARGIAHNLAGSFGDLLVLVRSPIRFAAMAERVKGDLEGLGEQCRQVVVVAHSQGSAVAWHAIRRLTLAPKEKRPPISIFLTFGQALRKLKALYIANEDSDGIRNRATLLALLSTILLLGEAVALGWIAWDVVISHGGEWGAQSVPGVVLLAAFLLPFPIFVTHWMLGGIVGDTDDQAERAVKDEFCDVRAAFDGARWIDVWASADPASNGPIFQTMPDGVESFKVRNLASSLLDHSVYWDNVTEFVSTVVFACADLVGGSVLRVEGRIPKELMEAASTRDRRVSDLAAGRIAYFAALIIGLYGVRHALPGWGESVLAFLQDLPFLPDWFNWRNGFWEGALALALISAAALVGWSLLVRAWGLPIRSDERAFFARGPSSPPGGYARIWFVVALAIPTAAVLALWQLFDDVTGWSVIGYLSVTLVLIVLVRSVLEAGGRRLGDDRRPDRYDCP